MFVAELPAYKRDFIELMLSSGVLTFGDFTTKSGRRTPYFINMGNLADGPAINRLGEYYASALHDHFGRNFENLYGPAYKGIPLAVTTAAALARLFRHDVTFTFNRKEAKDHGEGGALVGHRYRDGERVVIIEDVITAGTSIGESVPLIRAQAKVTLKGVIVAVDRQEKGKTGKSALVEVADAYGFPVGAIVKVREVVEYLKDRQVNGQPVITPEIMARIEAYWAEYAAF